MTNTENHMVIGLDEELDRMFGPGEWQDSKDREDYERLKEAADKLISGGNIDGPKRWSDWDEKYHKTSFDFGDVITRVWEDDSFPDCAKEILELYPDSKLAKLIKHMAVVVAADALDIEI